MDDADAVKEEDDDDDDAGDNEEEEEHDEAEDAPPLSPPLSSSASIVRITVGTSVRSPLVDRSVKMIMSHERTILLLRQAVGRTPTLLMPPSAVRLRHRGRLLDNDDMTVDNVLSSRDEDDVREEEEDIKRLSLTCDVIPPVDPKFGIKLQDRASTMSTKEILDAGDGLRTGIADEG